jgi:muramoyltetrapeptide carboxypeptidase
MTQRPIIPRALSPGDTVGLVAPSRWPEPAWTEAAAAWLESSGFKVRIHPQNALKAGRLAGPDAARAGAINDMFADDGVKAILCTRGGQGAIRVLDLIDYDLVRRKPKIFCSFSDGTVILNALRTRANLVAFHGPMGWNFSLADNDRRTGADLLRLLTGRYPAEGVLFPAAPFAEGSAEGPIAGGNMSMLSALIGTPYDWSADGAILFIEDVDEEIYRLDRLLWHFRQARKLDGVRGVIVGEMTQMKDDPPYGKSLAEILRDHLPPGIPVCTDFPCGHGSYLTTLPLGVKARLEVSGAGARLSLVDPAVAA